MRTKGKTNVTNSTWRGPATWPRLQAEANMLGRIRVLSVDRKSGALVVETIGRHQ